MGDGTGSSGAERLFVSVAGPDRPWARWIADRLQRAGYDVEYEEWHWPAGSNLVERTESALARADRVIAIVSEHYLANGTHGAAQRRAALDEAREREGFLVPVIVGHCALTPLLKALMPLDLVGCDEIQADERLLAGLRPPGQPATVPWPGPSRETSGAPAEAVAPPAPFPGGPGAPSAVRAPRDCVTVLHLPSLRAGQADTPVPVDELGDLIARDVAGFGAGWAPDLVVVTGDLAEHGRASEYRRAVELFDRLLGEWGLPRTRLAMVPGRRDVNPAACRAYFDSCEADEVEPQPPFFPKWRHYAAMIEEFYGDVRATSADGPVFTIGQEWSLFRVDELRLVIAGVNSTIAATSPDDDRPELGDAQSRWFAERLADYARRDWLRLGIIHQLLRTDPSWDDISGAQQVYRGLNLAFTGDLSANQIYRVESILLGARVREAAAKAPVARRPGPGARRTGDAPTPDADGPAYGLVRIDPAGMTRRTRGWDTASRRWHDSGGPPPSGPTRATQASTGDPATSGPRLTHWPVLTVSDDVDGTGGRRLAQSWKATEATFPAALAEDRALEGAIKEALTSHRSEPATRERLIDRVAEVARLRHAASHGSATVIEIAATADSPRYLRVTSRDGAIVAQHPVGVLEGAADPADVDLFATRVHNVYGAFDPSLVSVLVYGGAPAPAVLVRAAYRQGIQLMSFVEYQGLIDLRSYVDAQTGRLDRDPLYPPSLYLPQGFRALDLVRGGADTAERDALDQLTEWIGDDQGRMVLVLGDFGRGKTFLLHELARTLPERLPHVIPMLVELRSLEKSLGLDELVAAHLVGHGVSRFDQERFRYMLRSGRVVLLFDGFDELALRVTYERAAEHLTTLLGALEGQAKLVLSSRSQHFRSDDQVRTALAQRLDLATGRRVIELNDFTEAQIEEFLTRFYDGDADQARQRLAFIRGLEGLLGLARNPRMLSFIARLDEDRLRHVQAATGTMTPADLYTELLDAWMESESRRAHPTGAVPGLTTDDRFRAVKALALELWQSTDRTVSSRQLAEITERVLTTLDAHGLDKHHAAHQVGSGTLLVRAGDDAFTFVHQSVMEYLVATACAEGLRTPSGGVFDLLDRRVMSTLMASFVADLAGTGSVVRWARVVLGNPAATNAARHNALTLARTLDSEASRGARLAGARLDGADLSGLDLTDADLTGADLTGATLTNTVLRGARLDGAIMVRATLTETNLDGTRLVGTDLTQSRLTRCSLLGIAVEGSLWYRAAVVGCVLDVETSDHPALSAAGMTGRDAPAVRIRPASASASAPTFSSDGSLLAYAAGNMLVLVDTETETIVASLTADTGRIELIHFSPSNDRIAAAMGDKIVRIWDTTTGTTQHTLTENTGIVRTLAYSPDGLHLAASSDRTVQIWDTTTGTTQHTLTENTDMVWALAYSPDGTQLATASTGGTVQIWDTTTGTTQHTLAENTGMVWALAYSPDGTQLAGKGDNGTVHIWDAITGTTQHTLAGHFPGVEALAYSPDGTQLAATRLDGAVDIWNPATGTTRHTLTRSTGVVWALAYSPDGTQLATTSSDGTAYIWNTTTGTTQHTASRNTRLTVFMYSPDGRSFAAGRDDGTIHIWDTTTGATQHTLTGHASPVRALTYSPDGTHLATASDDGTVHIWDTTTGTTQHTLTGHASWGLVFAYSPDGSQLAAGGDSTTVQIWDTGTGTTQRTITEHTGVIRTLAYSPDGIHLATACDDGTVHIWDTTTGTTQHTLAGHADTIQALAYSPDGLYLAAGSHGTVHIWDTTTGTTQHTLAGHAGWIRAVSYSPDGIHLATAGIDGTIRICDTTTGTTRHVLHGHFDDVTDVQISPDGLTATSISRDGTCRLWELANGQLRAILLGLRNGGWATLWPDGSYTAEGEVDGDFWWQLRLCRFGPGELDPYVEGLRAIPPPSAEG